MTSPIATAQLIIRDLHDRVRDPEVVDDRLYTGLALDGVLHDPDRLAALCFQHTWYCVDCHQPVWECVCGLGTEGHFGDDPVDDQDYCSKGTFGCSVAGSDDHDCETF